MSGQSRSSTVSLVVFVALFVAIGAGLWTLTQESSGESRRRQAVVLYCARDLQEPVKELTRRYFTETHTRVLVRLANANELETTLQSTPGGDLALVVGNGVVDRLHRAGLVAERVPVGGDPEQDAQITAAVLATTERPRLALHFARYLAAAQRGGPVFEKHGHARIPSDFWSVEPRLVLALEAVLEPALEETLGQFEEREGCSITRVYQGGGLLEARLRGDLLADAYLLGGARPSTWFAEHFAPTVPIAEIDLVLATTPGNPRGLTGLASLCVPGLRVGLAHPGKSALGARTQAALRAAELLGKFRSSNNLQVESATGAELAKRVTAGTLDACVCYRSDTSAHAGKLDVLPIGDTSAKVTQYWAVSKTTRFPRLLGRLRERLGSPESRARFAHLGFTWLAPEPR